VGEEDVEHGSQPDGRSQQAYLRTAVLRNARSLRPLLFAFDPGFDLFGQFAAGERLGSDVISGSYGRQSPYTHILHNPSSLPDVSMYSEKAGSLLRFSVFSYI
jgi:hypothetical protein